MPRVHHLDEKHLSFILQRIQVNQIKDLFPSLDELSNQRSTDAFYLIKVWVRSSSVSFSLNFIVFEDF